MIKYFFIRFCICLGFCVATCFVGLFLIALFEPSIKATYIFGGVVSAICSIIVIVILRFICMSENAEFIIGKGHEKSYMNDKGFFDFWHYMCANGKKVNIGKCVLCLLPMAVISVVMILMALNTYSSFEYTQGNIILSGLISINAVYWGLMFIYAFFHYLRFTCFRCGAVFSSIEHSTSNGTYVNNVQTRSHDIYGTIGTVYSGNEKVGEVRGKVGTIEKKYKTFGSKYKSHCCCKYCGKPKKYNVNTVETYRIQ